MTERRISEGFTTEKKVTLLCVVAIAAIAAITAVGVYYDGKNAQAKVPKTEPGNSQERPLDSGPDVSPK